jgi:hypothetical protein
MFLFQKIRKCVAILMLVCWSAMLSNNIVYWHGHKLANGTIIWHAHPYQKSSSDNPFPDHSHSNSELILLDLIANLLIVLNAFVCFSFVSFVFYKRKNNIFAYAIPYFTYFSLLPARAPPCA